MMHDKDQQTILDDASKTKWSRKQIITLITLMLAEFFVLSSYSILAPFFPQMKTEKGIDDVTIGFLFAIYELVMFIMAPIYGLLIVRAGPRFLCVLGCFLCGGSTVVFGLLKYTDPPIFTVMCFISRACQGNGAAMLVVASTATLVKSLPSSASKTIGYMEMGSGLGYVAGPVIGIALYSVGGYPVPFLIVGGLTVILSVALYMLLPDVDIGTDEKLEKTTNYWKILKIPGVTILFFHCCIACISVTFLEPALGPFMIESYNSTPSTIGLTYGAWSLVYALFCPVFGKLADKGYLFSAIVPSIFGMATCLFLLSPSPLLCSLFTKYENMAGFLATLVSYGIFEAGVYIAPFQAVLNQLLLNGYSDDIHTYGMVSGLINSAYSLGSFSGPMLSGFLTHRYNFPWAITLLSFLSYTMGAVLLGYVILMRVTGRPLHRDDTSSTYTGDQIPPSTKDSNEKAEEYEKIPLISKLY